MGKIVEFADVKVGDKIVKHESGFGSEKYNVGTVDKVTNTRFTVDFNGYTITFTKDGSRYPRQTGYHRSYARIEKATPELLKLASNHRKFSSAQYALRELGEKAYKLKFENSTEEQIEKFQKAVLEVKKLTEEMKVKDE